MDSTTCIESPPGVAGDVQHAPCIEALKRYLIERRHAAHSKRLGKASCDRA